MANRIQLRRGTAAEWTAANPVLGDGEPGVEKDTGKVKYGNGVAAWTALSYASKGDQGPAGVADDASVKSLITTPGSQTATALSATYLPKWKASTAYVAGAQVVAPTGETVSAKVGFTSGATFSAANWNFPTAVSAPGVTFVTLAGVSQAVTIPSGSVIGLALTQGAGGSKTASWPAGIRWDGGTAPTLSTVAGATDVVTLVADGSGGWFGKLDGRYAAPTDTTAPSAVTGLTAGTATSTTVPLSWTAATDNIGIAGYEYSTNGTTYTATGSTGTSYTVTALTASTAYTLYVRAYDAAGNRGTAASVAKTTAAAAPVGVTDTFTAADGTALVGRTTTTGALIWDSTSIGTLLTDGTMISPVINTNRLQFAATAASPGGAGLTLSQSNARVSIDYNTVTGDGFRLAVAGQAAGSGAALAIVIGTQVTLFNNGATTSQTYTIPTTGRLGLEYNGTNIIVYLNGAAVITYAATGKTGTRAGVGITKNATTWLDNFAVDYL